MDLPRSAGVLLHVGSLPSGRIDEEAYRFVDWLAECGMRWWQILPLAPPDFAGSPYASPSSLAIDPALLPPGPASTADETTSFLRAEAYWIAAHAARFGPGSVDEQARADRVWGDLRRHAAARGVGIVGDLPIYVAPDGVEQRAHPRLFREGLVAGVPPDAFTDDGQRWGNPLYDWSAMAADGHRLFVERLRRSLGQADVVRIDHFRGFAGYWAIPADHATARDGWWEPGPGADPFRAAEAALGPLPVIAEDLGVITDDVHALREELGFPGMRVLQFAFDGDGGNPHLPANHPDWCVAYTGTHDNDTLVGWWESAGDEVRARAHCLLGREPRSGADACQALIRALLESRSRLAVVPGQDLLALGSEARLNRPGTVEGNWRWRLPADWCDRLDPADIRRALVESGRVVDQPWRGPRPAR